MKKSIILKSLGLNKLSSTRNLLKKTMQVTAFTFSCLVVLPSFVQTADAQTGWDDSIVVWGYPIDDPWGDWGGWADDDWGCQQIGCESSDDGGGGSSGGSNNNYDPVICNNLTTGTNNPNYVPGNPNAPLWCVTDPGTSLQVLLSTIIWVRFLVT